MRTTGKQHSHVIQIIGWIGVVAILTAYALLNLSVVSPHSVPYVILNIAGSACIILEAWSVKDWQPFTLNIIWLALAFIGLLGVA